MQVKLEKSVYDVEICTLSCGVKLVLGIHSNTAVDSSRNAAGDDSAASDGYTDGHAWISLNFVALGRSAHTRATFGVWPDAHPLIQTSPSYSSSSEVTDIRRGMEDRYTPSGVADRYARIDDAKIAALERHLEQNVEWSYTENCSGFAVDTWNKFVPNDRLDANDYLWFIETPRELGSSIRAKENEKATSVYSPL